jgi:hypothetical protein
MDVCPETFTKLAVVRDIKFNMENDPAKIFQEREHSRAMRRAGRPGPSPGTPYEFESSTM